MSQYEVAEVYHSLRNTILSVTPEQLGLNRATSEERLLGMLMEIGYASATATLMMAGDGAVSLYFSNGGGQIGYGQYDAVRDTAADCLELAESYKEEFELTEECPLPDPGHVRFYLLSFNGVLTAEAEGDELGGGDHSLSPLFRAGHRVITAMRMIQESQSEEEEE